MTNGREKKPVDFQIPNRERVRERVFDDTEPLIVDGRPLEPHPAAPPAHEAAPVYPERERGRRDASGAMERTKLFGYGALTGIVLGALMGSALGLGRSSAGLDIEPLAQLKTGTIVAIEKATSQRPAILSIDVGSNVVKKTQVDLHGHDSDNLIGRKVAIISGNASLDNDPERELLAVGLLRR